MLKGFIVIVLAISAYYDIKERKIPNKLIFPSICLALIIQIIKGSYLNILIALIVFAVTFVMFCISNRILGGGDVKLLVFIALMIGESIYKIIFTASILMIPLIVFYAIKKHLEKKQQLVPLAVPFLIAILINIRVI